MDTAQELLAAIRKLESAKAQAEHWRDALDLASPDEQLAIDARADIELLATELARLRREFAVQLARQLRPE